MAIFDANKKQFLNVNVVLTDPAAVAAAQAAYPGGRNIAPYSADTRQPSAAIIYNAPFKGYTQPKVAAPFTWTPWSGTADQGGPFPLNISRFSRHTGGFFGIGGTTVTYYWMAQFVLAADATGVQGGAPAANQANIPVRRWVEGFEHPAMGVAASGFNYSPDASRHPGGIGFAMRSGATGFLTGSLNQFNAAYQSARSWERFYMRVRALPSSATTFWTSVGFPSSATAFALGLTASGQLAIYSNTTATDTLVTVVTTPVLTPWTGLPAHDAWHRIDLLIDYVAATFRVYLDGTLVGSASNASMGAGNRHAQSQLGNIRGIANAHEIDFDDWINANIPTRDLADPAAATAAAYNNATAYVVGNRVTYLGRSYVAIAATTGNLPTDTTKWEQLFLENLTGKDFNNGSKIALIRPTGFGAAHDAASWPAEYRRYAQNPYASVSIDIPAAGVATTASAVLEVTTDSDLVLDGDPGSIGVASMQVSMLSSRGTTSGTLGYTLNGAAAVLAAIVQGVSFGPNSVLYTQTQVAAVGAEPTLPDITPVTLRHVKGADVGSSSVYALMAQCEMIGKWTKCDTKASDLGTITKPAPVSSGNHNHPFPRSPWATVDTAAPISPYVTVGGTYVGNGTGQDISFRAAPHWIFIRPLTGGGGGYFWLSSGLGSHRAFNRQVSPQFVDVQEDPGFVAATGVTEGQVQSYRMRITGLGAQINAAGVTYQYIAVCDPGMRFCLNTTTVKGSSTQDGTVKLVDAAFAADFAMVFAENPNTDTNFGLFAKDKSGYPAADLGAFGANAPLATGLTLGTGVVTTGAALQALAKQITISLWRRADGTKDTGQAAAVAVGSYIGDGSASRTVNLAPASGKRPMFAMVFAGNTSNGYSRDPSNTGSNSTSNAGTDAATGITSGGIDSFSVGSSLNANAVVYTYFVIPGQATACNNGWGCNGENIPVEPTGPATGPWPPDPNPDFEPGGGGVPPGGGGGGTGGVTPDPDASSVDFGAECIAATTAMVNRALSRIGISKVIGDVGTELSVEAAMARVNWGLDVNQTLRDFPWPFATRYANLVLVAGTDTVGANLDWQYSYRAPTDMVMARRIVGQNYEKRSWAETPVLFELGSDATGPLVYTNAPGSATTPVQLEYTVRVSCPASRGDALFRSALCWRHAASLAGPLSRDPQKVQFCLGMYQRVINEAETVAAQEQQQDKGGDAAWITGRN